MKKYFLFILIFYSPISIFPQNEWQLTGLISGGDFRNLEITPNGTLFAGLQNGSLFIKKNDSSSWEKVIDGTNRYASGGTAGLLAINDSLIFYNHIESGTYKSTDGGLTWKKIIYHYGSLHKNSSNHIFKLGMYSCDELSVSTDLGETWQDYSLGVCNMGVFGDIEFAKNDSMWIVGSYNGVLISTDFGINWEFRNNGLPANNKGVYSVYVDDKDNIFLGMVNQGVFYSSNYGNNWVPLRNGITNSSVRDLVAVNDSTFYAATKSGLYYTTDRGANWNYYNSNTHFISINKLLKYKDSFLAATAQSLFLINEEEILFFDEGVNDVVSYKFYEFENKIYSLTNFGLYYSENNGNNWNLIDSAWKRQINDITSSDDYLFFVCANELFYSKDGLSDWKVKTTPENCYSIISTHNNILYAGIFWYNHSWGPPTWENLSYSIDIGNSWQEKYIPELQHGFIHYLHKDRNSNLFLLGHDIDEYYFYISKSINNGEDFESYNQGITHSPSFKINNLVIDLNNNSYLSTNQGVYFRGFSDDKWMLKGLADKNIKWISVDSSNIVYAITDSEVYYSRDNGLTYLLLNDGLPNLNLTNIYYSHNNKTLFLGTQAGIYNRSSDMINSQDEVFDEEVITYKLFNYPNPFNSSTTIIFDLPQSNYTQISIYNSIGQLIKKFESDNIEKGTHKLIFDASNIPSGVYFYKLTSGNYTQTKKMVLLK